MQHNHILNTMHSSHPFAFVRNSLKINSHCPIIRATKRHTIRVIDRERDAYIHYRYRNVFYLYVLCNNNEQHRFTGENGFSIGHRPYLHNKLPVVSIYYAIVDYSYRKCSRSHGSFAPDEHQP